MTTPDAAAPARRRLLILDDEPIVVKRLKPAFQKAGYDVAVFTDSAAALAAFEQNPAHIVITDLKMEGIDGIAFLDRIKAVSPDTGVIVITGFATLETAKESFRKGAFDFVAKPFKLGDIVDCVKRIEGELRDGKDRTASPIRIA